MYHDMGGVAGYGRVEPEEDEPVFHNEWEGRVFGFVATVRACLSASHQDRNVKSRTT